MTRDPTSSDHTLAANDPTAVTPTTTTGSTPSMASGEKIGGRYQILSLLGTGGMGAVYRVRDTELDEVVALKMLHRHMVGSPGVMERFRQEVKLARRVTHKNVARTFDIGEHQGEKYLTMEYVDGESLSTVLRRRGALPLGEAVAIALSVCHALEAAHGAGVVHRDLKPDNIMFARDGRVVVTDFGIAHGQQASGAALTVGIVLGTPAYMAPEQVEAAPVDGRADLYALGAVLYEMLTGARAWPGDVALAVAAARLTHPPPDPRARRPELAAPLAEIVLRLLSRRPEDRFAQAAEVAQALLAFASVAPTAQTPAQAGTATPSRGLPTPVGQDKSLAVLPLRNTGAPDDAYLADGLTEDLIDALSMTHGLRVRARAAVMPFKGLDLDPRELGTRLEVQVVVDGSVRKVGEQVRMTVRLLNVGDGFQLWARRFERPIGELLQVNEEAARAIAEALSAKRAASEREAPDSFAIELYLRARQLAESHMFTPREAISLLDQALQRAPRDPTILSAYAMALARGLGTPGTRIEVAGEAAQRAVEVAPELGEPWLALATFKRMQCDDVGALEAVKRALRNAPSLAGAEDLAGRILLEVAPVEEGITHLNRARWINPHLPMTAIDLARAYSLLGQYDVADGLLAEMAGKQRLQAWIARLRLWAWRGQVAPDEEAPPVEGRDNVVLARVWRDVLISGLTDEMRTGMSERFVAAPARAGRRFYAQINAEILSLGGAAEEALAYVRRGLDDGLIDINWLDRVPCLQPMRELPGYAPMRAELAARARAIYSAWK